MMYMIKGVLEVVFETSQPAEDACHGTWFCEPRDTERDVVQEELVGELPCAKGEPNARLSEVLSRGTFRRWVALLGIPPFLHVVYIYLSIYRSIYLSLSLYMYIPYVCVSLSHTTHTSHTTRTPPIVHMLCVCLPIHLASFRILSCVNLVLSRYTEHESPCMS